MSDTDDTDVLILIPPNFFNIPSPVSDESPLDTARTVVPKSTTSCTARVLSTLVDQVYSLENRLDTLELTTEISSCDNSGSKTLEFERSIDSLSITRKCSTFPHKRSRKTLLRKRLPASVSISSLQSTSVCDTSIPPLNLSKKGRLPIHKQDIDESPSMDGDLSSIVSTPSKNNDKLFLNEIDEFLNKVEAYETPETKNKAQESEHCIKATGDYIKHKLTTDNFSNNEDKLSNNKDYIPKEGLDKYIYLMKNNPESDYQEKSGMSTNSYNTLHESSSHQKMENHPKAMYDSKCSVATRSPSARKLNFIDNSKDIQQTSTPKRLNERSNAYTFRPSSNKIYERASKVLEQYKQTHSSIPQNVSEETNCLVSPKKDDFKVPQGKPYLLENRDCPKLSLLRSKLMDTIDTELLSLCDLWGDKKENVNQMDAHKLEEEKMKREHCEVLIQELQRKLLDQQERLAVAVKVDRNKDAAITKLRDAWVRLTSGLDKTEERHKVELEKMSQEVEKFKAIADESQKKTHHYEAELYKALDLAHDYQEKCKHFANAHMELKNEMDHSLAHRDEIIRSKDKENEVLRDNYETVMRMNKQSTECVKNIEMALEKEKRDHDATKANFNEVFLSVHSIQEELNTVKQERDLLNERVNEERGKYCMAENQLAEKQNQNCDLLRKCDSLDSEIKSLHRHLEMQKNELKCHYQKQLETAVMSKLQEFQQQLQQAEADMQADTKNNERAIVDAFNKQINRIEEQHKLEIKILEEKHKEEIKLYRLQLAQANDRVESLESKLSSYRERRSQLAEQLHGVMEAQWRQALSILTHPDTSRLQLTRSDAVSSPDPLDYAPPKIPPLASQSAGRVTSQRRTDRRTDSQMFNFEALSDNELQQYVKMLLTKPPNMNIQDSERPSSAQQDQKDLMEEPTSDRLDKLDKRQSKRGMNTSKPPWKS